MTFQLLNPRDSKGDSKSKAKNKKPKRIQEDEFEDDDEDEDEDFIDLDVFDSEEDLEYPDDTFSHHNHDWFGDVEHIKSHPSLEQLAHSLSLCLKVICGQEDTGIFYSSCFPLELGSNYLSLSSFELISFSICSLYF